LPMIEAAEIERMSLAQKLQTMELIWKSLSVEEERLESPHWHKTVLEGRLAKVEAGKGKFYTMDQLKKRLSKRVK
jgi:putative addiction module component (TIGR02574 family)